MIEVSEEVLAKMHDDMIDIAAAADFVRGRIRIGHNGEGEDDMAALDAIHDDALAQAAAIGALLTPGASA